VTRLFGGLRCDYRTAVCSAKESAVYTGAFIKIRTVPNRLVLHQAAKVRNERATVQREYFVLVFFMQGKDATP
jgi:hypothetical protein